ncbi:hypothetical protein [Taibaiella koreensis]|uniref:hypothetical protein n=1 Tax=Taibaiella koreensis TaxID=1268548 RepID=UPI000E59D58E|nr:hypothetical protein [Taibaiella koreensis]
MICNLSVLFVASLALLSCRPNATGTSSENTETDCQQQKTIKGLSFYFNHYPYAEMDTIRIKVGGGSESWESFGTPQQMVDSLREQRYFYFERTINITDTVFFKLKNGKVHAAYNFRYLLRPHRGSATTDYSCDFYELYLDGEKQTGGVVSMERSKK